MEKYKGRMFLLCFVCVLSVLGCTANENAGGGVLARTFQAMAAETKVYAAGRQQENGTENGAKNSAIVVGDMDSHNNTDVVLVMDESGTMLTADPKRLAIEGAKLFIDMQKISGIGIGLVEFPQKGKAPESTGIIQMQQKQNKEFLKGILDRVVYDPVAHTDTGAAMLEAVSVLDSSSGDSDSNNDKAIVLFTDGRTDIDKDTPGRTTKDSIKDLDTAVSQAKKKGYKIYCIGLDANGKIDRGVLEKIAGDTGGKCHIAKNVNTLRKFFNSIFSEIDGAKEMKIENYISDGGYHQSKIKIKSANVAEANIVILSSQKLKDIQLKDNHGDPVNLQKGSDKVYFATSNTYSVIKLIRPETGNWILRVKGVRGDQIQIGMVYNYDLGLVVEADRTIVPKGQGATVKAYLATDGEPFTSRKFYEGLSGYIQAEADGQDIIKQDLALNEAGTALTGVFTPPQALDYQVFVHLEGDHLVRNSERFWISAREGAVLAVKELGTVKLEAGEEKEIDLGEYFSVEDGQEGIVYSVEPIQDGIEGTDTEIDTEIDTETDIEGGNTKADTEQKNTGSDTEVNQTGADTDTEDGAAAKTDGRPVQAVIQEGSILHITGNRQGEADFLVYAKHASAQPASSRLTVICTAKKTPGGTDIVIKKDKGFSKYVLPALLALLLVLVAAAFLAWLFRRGKRRIAGSFRVGLEVVKQEENGASDSRRFEIKREIPASSMGSRRAFTLEELLRLFEDLHAAAMEEQEQKELEKCCDMVKEDAKKIKFCSSKIPYEIKISNTGGNASFIDHGVKSDQKSLAVRIDPLGSRNGLVGAGKKEFGIRIDMQDENYTQVNIVYKNTI